MLSVLAAAVPGAGAPSPEPGLEGVVKPDSGPCIEEAGSMCAKIYDWTGQEWLATSSNWLIVKPAKVLLILVVALLARWLLHWLIARLAHRAAEGTIPGVLQRAGENGLLNAQLLSERRRQRAGTMASVLKSVATGIVFVVAVLMILAELELDITPLIASAGIVGVAFGFGAQTLVKDFLSGIFLIMEDQYGVGDIVDLGGVIGEIEGVGLRVTRLRDVDGAVWYVRNGEIIQVGNMSQQWARALLDVRVSYRTDLDAASEVIKRVADQLWREPAWAPKVLEEPEIWGVQSLDVDSATIRLVLKTVPLEQWGIARELRGRLKAAFDAEGIEIPLPQRSIWIRATGPGGDPGGSGADDRPDPETA